MSRQLFLMISIVVFSDSRAFAEPAAVGDYVVVIADPAVLKTGSRVVGTLTRGTFCFVNQVNAGWYWVHGDDTWGWISSREVISRGEALRYFTDAIHRAPTARDFGIRGHLRSRAGDHRLAISDFGEAIRRDPTEALHHRDRAVEWSLVGQTAKAIADLSEAIRLEPNNPSHRNLRAFRFMEMGEYRSAIDDYRESIRVDPNNVSTRIQLGHALAVSGDLDGAIAAFNEAIRIDPQEPPDCLVYVDRASAWTAKGREDLAKADFEEAIRRTKNYPWYQEYPFMMRATTEMETRRYADALADCDTIIKLNPNQGGAYAMAAWILATSPGRRIRDGAKALEYATTAIKLGRSDGDADRCAILAAAYAEIGRFEEAVQFQKRAIDSAPEAVRDNFRHALTGYESRMPFRDNAQSGQFRPEFHFEIGVQ